MSSVDIIKERINIADVVGGYVKLEKAGANFRARCPFHTEKTPSFFVSPMRGTFHCFGCNKGGDVFTFVQEIEGLDFSGALKMLAERAGVDIPQFTKREATEEEELRTILEATTIFFQKNLAGSKEPIAYLYGRGLNKKSLEDFRLGFAPAGFENVKHYLAGKGFSEARAERAGVLVRGTRGYHDRFRSRIMFPLFDSVGRVVGFSGRIFGDDDGTLVRPDGSSGVAMGKYVNTPETPLYHKSRILYGYDRAKTVIREEGSAVFVEGQMDLIAAHQGGVKNAVAVSGTAFSEHHAAMIARLVKKIVLAFDADEAGRKAALRSAKIAFARGLDVLSAEIPEGKDPADIVKESPALFPEIVKNAKPFIMDALAKIKKSAKDTREFRREASIEIVPLLVHMENKIDQAHFAGEMAKALGIPEESIWEEIARTKKDTFLPLGTKESERVEIGSGAFLRMDILARHIEGIIFWQEKKKDPEIVSALARARFRELRGRDVSESDAPERAFEAELYFEGKNVAQEIKSLFLELEKEMLKEHLTRATEELREAETEGNRERIDVLLAECGAISKKIAQTSLKA
ncbi:MAG: DNA primase [Patescibacteria group bacterium]